MVGALWGRLVTSLERILCRQDIITLQIMPDQGTSYTQKFMLSSEQDLIMLREVLSMWPALIGVEDLQKLNRAGLAHVLYETRGSHESYTPQQMEFAFMTFHNAEDVNDVN